MDIPMCMRTFRVPASSVFAKILRLTSAQDHVPGTERPKLVNEVPKGPGCSCSKMCARQKPELWDVCYESRSLVHMIVGTWCLPMSIVTCSRKCNDPIRPSVLVKVSWRLCRLVFLAVCNASSTAFEGTASGSMDWMQPLCCANMFQLVSCRLPCTCSTDTFFTKHYSPTRGAVPNMLDLRRRSSFPILFRSGMIQLETAQNCFVKCVIVRVRDDVEGVQLRTQLHSTMGTPHPHAVTVLREKGVDVTSHNKRPDTVVVVGGQRGMASSWIQEWILDMLVPLVVEGRCCDAGDVAGAQRWSTSRDSLVQQIDTGDS